MLPYHTTAAAKSQRDGAKCESIKNRTQPREAAKFFLSQNVQDAAGWLAGWLVAGWLAGDFLIPALTRLSLPVPASFPLPRWHPQPNKQTTQTNSTTTSVGGRGPAMNAGARVARGDLLLFVHADTIVPPAFDATLRTAFQDPEILMSTFLFGINRALLRGKEPFGMAVMERVTNYRTRTIHLPYGDQAS